MWKQRWACAVAALLLGAGARGFGGAPPPRYTIKEWTIEEGLPQNAVISLVQTRDGYLWLGTGEGLARFDGVHFRRFESPDAPEMQVGAVVKLFEDRAGNLWAGTDAGGVFSVGRDGKTRTILTGKDANEGPLTAFCEDAVGGVWLRLAKGRVYRYFEGRARPVADRTTGLAAGDDGIIWVGTPDGRLVGLGPINAAANVAIPVSTEIPVGRLVFLLGSRHGGDWVLANDHIQRIRGTRVVKDFGRFPWTADVPILAACEDRDGNLVVGTYGNGVWWFDAAGNATKIENLSHSSIWSVLVDEEGNLWIGTNGGGLSRVKRRNFDVLDGTQGVTVQSVCRDAQDGLWIGYNGEHLDHWTGGKLESYTSLGLTSREMPFSGGPRYLYVRSVFQDRDQGVWAGVSSTVSPLPCLFRFQGGAFRFVPGPPPLSREVAVIHQDRQGTLWVGGAGGLAAFDGKTWQAFGVRDGLSSDAVSSIADDREGNLWIGTQHGGLNLRRDGKFTAFRQQDKGGLPSDDISSLLVDTNGVLWIGTTRGLARYAHGQWARYSTDDGLAANKIGYLLEDDLGFLWLGSNSGLMRVALKDLDAFAAGKASSVQCRLFGKADGLPATECSFGSQPAACRAKDGTLWFPTIQGLGWVQPTALRRNTNEPPVVIEWVKIDSDLQTSSSPRAPLPQEIVIPAGKEILEIGYTALNLSAPEKVRFRYRMVNHEEKWIPADEARVAIYPKLPPGNYRFQVTACNEDEVWNRTGCEIGVKVLPPFYRKLWFISLVTAVVLALIIGSVHYISTQRLQRQLAVMRQQEALEKERARIARDLHDQLGANLTQVALLGEMAETDKDLPDEVEAHARQICATARDTTHALDEIVWTVNPSNDTVEGLINYICKYAQDYLALAGLKYRLETPPQLPHTRITPELRHNVFLAAKEAINNVVKHAKASSAWLRLSLDQRQFVLEIEDDGRGLAGAETKTTRNGLKNMRKRMEDIGGRFEIGPRPEGGTKVSLTAPLQAPSKTST
jgi:signal transduction histidine kinase/ligand-binding sensor domain-containing protein